MRETSRRSCRFASASAVALAALLGGCGEAQPPDAPFGAKLVIATRDREHALYRFDRTLTKLYLWRQEAGVSQVFTLDLGSGEETLLADNVEWFRELGPRSGDGPLLFVSHDAQDAPSFRTLTLLDSDGRRSEFEQVDSTSVGASEEFLVFIREAFPRRELWAGRFGELRLVSDDLYVHDWRFIAPDRLALAAGPLVGTVPEPPGIFVVDLASGAISPEFSAKIDGAEWGGEGPAPALAADGLEPQTVSASGSAVVAQLAAACWSATERKAWGAADQRCYLLYVRHMADGTTRSFVGLPDEHREIALPGDGAAQFGTATGGNAPLAVWQSPIIGSPDSTFDLWDAANERFVSCPVASGAVANITWRDDGRALVYGDGETMRLVESGGDGCFELAAPRYGYAWFSPEGSRLIWIDIEGELWTARGDGRDATPRLTVPDLRWLQFIDEDRLLGVRVAVDGAGLTSIDLAEAAPKVRPIVEQVFGAPTWLGPRFLTIGNRYNDQDRTGKLGLIDVETYAVEDLADSVADSVVGYPPLPGADSIPFAYLRIGRFASARDGIWVGRIPLDHLELP